MIWSQLTCASVSRARETLAHELCTLHTSRISYFNIPVFYYVVEMPAFAVCIAAVVYIILAIAMVYYAKERFREIEEGLDDAVDDY